MRRLDLVIAAVIVALCAYAVWRQLSGEGGRADGAAATRAIEIGEAVEPDVVLADLEGTRHRLGDRFGEKATILYSWSTTCPCIPACEESMQQVYERHPPAQGFQWIAVAGEPTDTPDGIARALKEIGARYDMLVDPSHKLSRRLGFDRAAILAVVDPDGYLRFRGNLSDDLKNPTRNYLAEVLDAVSRGEALPLQETDVTYGCVFSTPIECEDDLPADAPPPSQ